MGLNLDSSVVIARERQGHSVLQILEQMKAAYGEIDMGLSVVTIAELVHGAYRAKTDFAKQTRLAFIDRLCIDLPVYPITRNATKRPPAEAMPLPETCLSSGLRSYDSDKSNQSLLHY